MELYAWLLKHYAKSGDKILDTHAGSASSLIACMNGGFEHIGFELDEEYYRLASERIISHRKQGEIFSSEEIQRNFTNGTLADLTKAAV